MNEFEIINIIG